MKISRTRSGAWRLDFRVDGHRRRETYATIAAASARASKIEQGTYTPRQPTFTAPAAGQPAPLSLQRLLEMWRANRDALNAHSPAYRLVRDSYITTMLRHFADLLAADLVRATFDAYVVWRRARGACDSTLRKDYSILCAALNFAVARGLLERNLLAGYFHSQRLRARTITPPTPAAIASVYRALPGEQARQLYWFLCATGCRITEAIQLEAGDIQPGGIHFHRGVKGGLERFAPRPDFPFALPATGRVFSYAGHQWRRDVFRHMILRACARAGVTRFTTHALRHANATYSLAAGETVYSLMSRCGWRSFSVMQRYVQLSAQVQKPTSELAGVQNMPFVPEMRAF